MSPRSGPFAEGGEPVAACLRRFEDLGVVPQVERAAHAAASTSTTSFEAAVSARRTRLLGRVRDRDHVAAAIAVPAHRPDRLSELEVRVRLHDALGCEHRVELADPRDAPGRQRPGLRGEEPDRERLREAREGDVVGDVLAERLQERHLDEVDADGVPHEVGHLAAGDARRDLDDGDARRPETR